MIFVTNHTSVFPKVKFLRFALSLVALWGEDTKSIERGMGKTGRDLPEVPWFRGQHCQFRTPFCRAIFSFTRKRNPGILSNRRIWWNWQSRYFEVVVPQGIQVQVLLSAPFNTFWFCVAQRRWSERGRGFNRSQYWRDEIVRFGKRKRNGFARKKAIINH